MMRDLYNALIPDDRPITSLCIIEDISGCPPNYYVVSKSYDQDIDADLCKDGFFKKITRYLCHSKTEGFFGYVVENILILNEREARPAGYTVLEQTNDTNQRAFRKKQLCYKAVPRQMATQTITDIIILSRSKVAPEGFSLFGEMNGLSICYKQGIATSISSTESSQPSDTGIGNFLPYSVEPNNVQGSTSSNFGGGSVYPGLTEGSKVHHPTRRAPMPPNQDYSYSGATLQEAASDAIYDSAQSFLSGVPFIMNKKYVNFENDSNDEIASRITKSSQQIEDEYYYSFTLEQDILQKVT